MMQFRSLTTCVIFCTMSTALLRADPPSAAYIFPAGGQRGTAVNFRLGGYNFHKSASFDVGDNGIEAVERITRTETLFFEGPLIPQPASQGKEDYPQDYTGHLKIADDAQLGIRHWHVATSQGVTPGKKFIVGYLPEVIEQEIDGNPIPTPVTLPVTINGRIFPLEDVDVWTFSASSGQTISCEVNASRLGSPLDSRLEVRGPDGRRIADNVDSIGSDSRLRFTAAAAGKYQVRIHDVNFAGLQTYVYRLTITAGPVIDAVYPLGGRRGSQVALQLRGANLPSNAVSVDLPTDQRAAFRFRPQFGNHSVGNVVIELDDLPEYVEDDSLKGDDQAQRQKVKLPAVLNGRILQPGDVDRWSFVAKQGEQYVFDLRASRLRSALDSVLTLLDSNGKQLAQNDDLGKAQTDSRLTFQVPADGTYTVRVEDRLSSRGGPEFAYRLRVTRPAGKKPGFRLLLPADTLTLGRDGEVKLRISVERLGGFQDEISLVVDNLPPGVTVTGTKIDKGKNDTQLVLKAEKTAKVVQVRIVVRGKAKIGDTEVEQRAVLNLGPGEPANNDLLLGVAVVTPFKVIGAFETKYASRGSVYVRHYTLQRGGFTGPIEIRLADIQARHLQGVTGPVITLPPAATKFDYPITLPPWMEIGRTSRTCVMAVGVVTDADGTKHTVSYSSTTQDDQIIVLVDPGRLNVRPRQASIRAARGGEGRVQFDVERAAGLTGPVTVALSVPKHIQGVTAAPVTVPADRSTGKLTVRFSRDQFGPFNIPLTIRASMSDDRGHLFTAESNLTVVTAE